MVEVANFYTNMKVDRCDMTGKTFDPPVMGAVSVSNTVRNIWEIDSKVGPNYVRDQNLTVISMDELKSKVSAKKGKLRLEV